MMWISGAEVEGAGERLPVVNPATEEVVDRIASATPAQVDAAVGAARGSADRWRRMPAAERGELLHGIAAWLREHAGALARQLTIEGGKPLVENVDEVGWTGAVWINDPLTDNDAGPFGGMKMSGNSRELGPEGLEAFRETKHVHWDTRAECKSWWYPYGG